MTRKASLKTTALTATESIEGRLAALEERIRRLPTSAPTQQSTASTLMVKQTTHGFAVKDVIRHNGTSWTKSQADTASNAVVGGIVVAVLSPDVFVMATAGYVAGLSGLTAGSVHYLSAATAGALTTTAPGTAVPVLLADSTTTGVIMALGSSGGIAPTEDGTVFCSNSAGTAGEWVLTVDIGRNAVGKAGKIQILSPDASGVAVEIDAALVTASTKKLKIQESDVCDGAYTKKILHLRSDTY
jgi:hypothetical protein